MVHWSTGNKAAVDGAIAAADVVVRQRFVNQPDDGQHRRDAGLAGGYDVATGDYTLWSNIKPTYPGPAAHQPLRPRHPIQQAPRHRAAFGRKPGLEGLSLPPRATAPPPREAPRSPGQMDRHPVGPCPLDRARAVTRSRTGAGRHARRNDHGAELHGRQQHRRVPGDRRSGPADRSWSVAPSPVERHRASLLRGVCRLHQHRPGQARRGSGGPRRRT